MANTEDDKLEFLEESADAIAKVTEKQRAWILKHIEAVDAQDANEARRAIRDTRLRVRWLLKATNFLEELSQTKDLQGLHTLLECDLINDLHGLNQEFDFESFPNYEKIVTEAMMYCLTQEDKDSGKKSRDIRIRDALTIKTYLCKALDLNDSTIPGYTDAWKAAFIYSVKEDSDLAIAISNNTYKEINLREIPDYEELVKDEYYRLMLVCHKREDDVFKSSLGDGIDFTDGKEQKLIGKMNECLNGDHDFHVISILYILKKFDGEAPFGPDNIENFEQGVKATFLRCLTKSNLGVRSAEIIKDKLGSEINFDDEVIGGLTYNLDQYKEHEHNWIETALAIKETFGKNVVFHTNHKYQCAIVGACMKLLQKQHYHTEYIVSIRKDLGEGVEFSENTVPGYNAAVQETFLGWLRKGDLSEARTVRDEFGQGVALDTDNLSDYAAAVRDGFIDLVNRISPEQAKNLIDEFGEGVEIEDKVTIVHSKFIYSLSNRRWKDAVKLKEEFEPEIMCDRENIPEYDDTFREALYNSLSVTNSDVSYANNLYEKLGEDIDITDILRRIEEKDTLKFIAFAKRDHWRAIFGNEALDNFLAALPKSTDEKRNAFTHNPYDHTTDFLKALCRTGFLQLDEEGFALITDFVRRFGLSRSETIYRHFYDLSKTKKGEPLPERITREGITSIDDLETRVKDLRQKVYGEETAIDLKKLSKLEIDLLALVTGKSSHRFDHGRQPIESIVRDFGNAQEAGEIAETPEEYGVETIEIPEVSIDFDPETIRTDYEILKQEIIESVEQPENIAPLLTQSLRIADKKLAILRNQGDSKFVLKQISEVEALRKQIESIQDLNALMTLLLQTRFMGKKNPFYSVMRQIVFRKIFIRNRSPEVLDDILARLSGEKISGQNVLEVIGIIDNMVKHHALNLEKNNKEQYWDQETWDSIKASIKDKKLINVLKIFSPHIGKLRNAAKNFKLNETGKTRKVRSIPDRGFVGEMSAYLADVCYSAEYPLLESRPNLIPHKLVVGEEQESEFFGSYLIFELEEDTGDKVMLVRGFNVPDEASIDIVKFIEITLDKLEATARKRGISKIVIPGLMGALTNYPLTKNYLYNKYVVGKQAIKLNKRFDFNNYDLTETCFVAREIEQPQPPQTPPPAMS